ncbi:uncharacterized protein LOC133385743 [Rhineura floridana]|uniref:uncharacterized protein LOC133385743 n=1 Tax=Rhineura floridana TaxID=261503 RepID=UPI002AC813BE|nr:uncharacterized protein LOC133385743 [Rhineura floridana]
MPELAHHPLEACAGVSPVVGTFASSGERPCPQNLNSFDCHHGLRSIPIKDLTLKTVFLVGITSARRVGELGSLSIREELCVFHPVKVVLRPDPSFLPKVNSLFHRGQDISLPNFCPNPVHCREKKWHKHDVKQALWIYLDYTEPFRRSEALFVSFKQGAQELKVSRSIISRWVKDCMVKAYQGSLRTQRGCHQAGTLQACPTGGNLQSHHLGSPIHLHQALQVLTLPAGRVNPFLSAPLSTD